MRYTYLTKDPQACSIGHFNLATFLSRVGAVPELVLAHRLAATVIDFQSGSGEWLSALPALASQMASFSPTPPPLPTSFEELCGMVEQMDGVRFRALFEGLPRRMPSGEEALRAVLDEARRYQETSGATEDEGSGEE
jgi:hypothetical protein